MAKNYRKLQGFVQDNKELQMITKDKKGLQEIKSALL